MTRTEFYGFLTQAIADGRYVINGINPDGITITASGTNQSIRLTPSGTGAVLVGPTTARTNFSSGAVTTKLQIEGTDSNSSRISATRNSADVSGPVFLLAKTRGTTVGSNTIVQSGDGVGSILFQGADGVNLINFASVDAAVDGTPGINDTPGRLIFQTTPDGSATLAERMRINSAGNVLIGTTTTNGAKLQVEGSVSIGTSGTPIVRVLSATAVLDFPSTLTGAVSDLTVTVTGAAVGDVVDLGVPSGSVTATATFFGWVSAADTVTVRFSHNAAGSEDPPSGTFRVMVTKF